VSIHNSYHGYTNYIHKLPRSEVILIKERRIFIRTFYRIQKIKMFKIRRLIRGININKNTNHIQEELVHCALALEGERDSG